MTRETFSATFEIVTPMFIVGADKSGEGVPELRVPSILGALRFWWRTLAWARLPLGDPKDAFVKLKKWEADLFGSAETGQGKFLARLGRSNSPLKASKSVRGRVAEDENAAFFLGGYAGHARGTKGAYTGRSGEWRTGGTGIAYLAGQGLCSYRSDEERVRDNRRALLPSQRFELILTGKPGFLRRAALDEGPSLLDALTAFGLLGGLGARTRRGFGSVRLSGLQLVAGDTGEELFPPITSVDDYVTKLISVTRPSAEAVPRWDSRPPYSAFWKRTSMVIRPPSLIEEGDSGGRKQKTQRFQRAHELHNEIGHRFQMYRGWGFNDKGVHKIGGEKAPQNFPFDHKWNDAVAAAGDAEPPSMSGNPPVRSVFGLPHAYTKRGKAGPKVSFSETDRRGSPLFLHIHTLESGDPFGVLTLFEVVFLPGHPNGVMPLRVSLKYGGTWDQNVDIDFNHVSGFLSDAALFADKGKAAQLRPVLP